MDRWAILIRSRLDGIQAAEQLTSAVPPVSPSTAPSDRVVCALAPCQGAGIATVTLCRICTCTPAQLD